MVEIWKGHGGSLSGIPKDISENCSVLQEGLRDLAQTVFSQNGEELTSSEGQGVEGTFLGTP